MEKPSTGCRRDRAERQETSSAEEVTLVMAASGVALGTEEGGKNE